jgi:uncharacterized protein
MWLKLSFSALLLGTVLALPTSAALILNEVDSDTVNVPNTDEFEFLELYDTSGASVPLDGYSLVFYNGNGNVVYRAEDLDGKVTRPNGFFVAGNVVGADLPIIFNTIQNGGDAVALFLGNAVDFPNGQLLSAIPGAATLVDAVIYKTGADTDADDMVSALLLAGGVVDEWGRDGTATTGTVDSIGRLPNASGGLRDTTTWTFTTPTPGLPNSAAIPEPASALLLGICGAFMAILRRRSS